MHQRSLRWYYRHYYTSCGFLWMNRCKTSRTYRSYYYVQKTYSRRKTMYFCCSGWRQSGSYCSIPICKNGCVHGKCTSPDTCTCNQGWTGSRCQTDIDECQAFHLDIYGKLASKGGRCQQTCTNTEGSFICGCHRGYVKTSQLECTDFNECKKKSSLCQCASAVSISICGAKCVNTLGSFKCSCGNGFKLISQQSNICRDVNECSGYNVCAQMCVNNIGSYRCTCRHGYLPKRNGAVCEEINKCLKNNGECEHICINKGGGSRKCTCRNGYHLDNNGRTCTDINECLTNNGECEHICTNMRGSRRCSCRNGYHLDNNGRTCTDVNECFMHNKGSYLSIANCQQICTNTDGSYTCGCRIGFQILSDGRSCTDVNECRAGIHQCSQVCINTLGSYKCSCNAGYELNKDGGGCRALPCQTTVKAPLYGKMSCTGMATNDTCSFACDYGYHIKGPSNVTCDATSGWSTPQPKCKPKSCGILSPRNAIVSIPCHRSFRSSCNMRCKSGYYSSGSSKAACEFSTKRNSVVWKHDLQCYHVKNCKPNPCRHGGNCVPLTSEEFHCDCSNTGYIGRLCERGVIEMPLFPKLKANLKSSLLSFKAKPSKEILMSIQSDDNIIAQPKVVKVMRSSTKAEFNLTPQHPGLKIIVLSIQGESARDYKKYVDIITFVSPESTYRNSVFAEIPILSGELPEGCHLVQTDMSECSAKLSSTLPWQRDKQLSTQGIVHFITEGGKSIPLSLLGFDFPFSSDGMFNKVKQLYQLNSNTRLKTVTENTCQSKAIEIPQLMELIENDVFAAAFFVAFSKFTPQWLKVHNGGKSDSFDFKDIHTTIGSESKPCSSVLKSSSVITFEPSIGSTITLDEDVDLPDEKGFCYAIDVCTSDVALTFPSESTKAIKSTTLFKDMKKAGWKIDLSGAMFPGDKRPTVKIGKTLWNGKDLESITSPEYKFMLRGIMNAKLRNKENINISLAFQGEVFIDTENLNKVFSLGFEREVKSVMKGKASLNITLDVFTNRVTIHLPEKEAFGKFLLGGSSSKQGLFCSWNSVPHLLKGTPFEYMVLPGKNQTIYVAMEYQLLGGKQTEIMNANEYKLKMTLLNLVFPQLKSMIKNTKMILSFKKETLDRWSTYINKAEILINDIQNVIKDLSSSSNLDRFSSLISKLKDRIRYIKLLCKVIESTVKNKMPSSGSSFINHLKKLKNDIPHIPSVHWKRSTTIEAFKSFKILFKGKMCSTKTCFDGISIILESVPSVSPISKLQDKKELQDSPGVIIHGKFYQPLKLGAIVTLKRDDHVYLEISRREKGGKLLFNATINLMGIQKVVAAEIDKDTLSFQTSGLIFGRHQALININAKTDYYDWSLIQYHVAGKIFKNSSLTQTLQGKINNYVRKLSEEALKRIKNAENEAKQANDRLHRCTQVLQQKIKIHDTLEKKNESLLIRLNSIKLNYTLLKDKLKESFYEDDLGIANQSCQLKKCEKICSTDINICTYKSRKRNITYNKPICSKIEKTIKKSKIVKRSQQSFYTKPTFTTQYTGDCGHGGFLKALANFFFGCSRTYESVQISDEKVYYTKEWLETVAVDITVNEFDCSKVTQETIKTESFEIPIYSCDETKCIKIMNPSCVKSNDKCFKTINARLHRPLSEYERYKAKQFKRLRFVENEMEIAAINLEKVKDKLRQAVEELKMAKAKKMKLESTKDLLEAALLDIRKKSNVIIGLKLSRLLEKAHHQRIVNILDFTFDVTVHDQNKKQIPMTLTVKSIDGNKKDLPVLFDFNNEEISILKIVKNLIQDLYEEKRNNRRKRSISEEDVQVLNNHRLCLKAGNVSLFYKAIVQSLGDLIHVKEHVEELNKYNVNKLISLYQTFKKILSTKTNEADETDNSHKVFKSYSNYFMSLIKEKQNFTRMFSEESLVSWKTFLEALTSEMSFSDCAGTKDCVVTIGEDLNELYLYESDFERAKEIRESLAFVRDGIIDLITKNLTLVELKYKVSSLKSHLDRTEDSNVLCGRKPEIISSSDKNQVVLENSTFTLFCNASSDTPVQYKWIHNNGSVYQSENGTLIIRKVNTSHAGSYKCKAINRKGSDISNVTIITIHSKPKIAEQPNNTKVYAKNGFGLLLKCNATGEPVPDIEWFFVSQYPNSSTVRVNNNGSFLYYKKPTKNYSGYYFCVASNIHGRAESKKAKALVLESSPGQPRLAAKMNVSKACTLHNSSLDCWRYRKGNTSDSNELQLFRMSLADALNSSISQVENISYISDGFGNSTVSFLYTSIKSTIEDITDQMDEQVFETYLDSFARKRLELGNGLKLLYKTMKNKTYSSGGYAEGNIVGDPDSLVVWVVPPGCPNEKAALSNGYMCANCPPGEYSDSNGRCIPCPTQTYQYEQGQTKCIPCENGLQTKGTRSTSPDECFKIHPAPPRKLQVTILSSSKLKVHWLEPKETSEFVRYYFIEYKRLGYKNKTEKVSKAVRNLNLTGLKKFTEYRIVVYAVYSGEMKMLEIMAKTGQDVPDAAPVITQCIPLSHDSARITWLPIPKHKRNGIIQGYKIYYKAGIGGRWLKWQSHTIEKGSATSGVVTGLRSSTWYCFKMSAFTSQGQHRLWMVTPCRMIKTPLRPLTVTGRALSSSEVLITLERPERNKNAKSVKVVHYGKRKNNLSRSKICFSSSCVIGNLEKNTLYYFKMQDHSVQDRPAPATIAVKTGIVQRHD